MSIDKIKKYKDIYSQCISEEIAGNSVPCPACGEEIILGRFGGCIVFYYPEALYECKCGTITNEKGEDKTDEYYT